MNMTVAPRWQSLTPWILGVATALAGVSINTYYRAEQVPAQAAAIAQVNTSLAQLNSSLLVLNQRLDDAQRDRDRMQAELDKLSDRSGHGQP